MGPDEKLPAEIAEIKRLAQALPAPAQGLDEEALVLPPLDPSKAAPLFELMYYYESLSAIAREHTEITSVVAKALSSRVLRLADEKGVVRDDFKHSVLQRVVTKGYSLPLIVAVLDRPDVSCQVRSDVASADNIRHLLCSAVYLPSERLILWAQCVSVYLSYMEHPWSAFFLTLTQTYHDGIYITSNKFNDQILNLFIGKMGSFPWHDEANFLFSEMNKSISTSLPTLGLSLLSQWVASKDISLESLEKFIGDKPVEWWRLSKQFQAVSSRKDFSICDRIFEQHYHRFELDEDSSIGEDKVHDEIKPNGFFNERIVFLLRKGMIQVTYDLLEKIKYRNNLFEKVLSFLTAQELCAEPERWIKIIGFLLDHGFSLDRIKALFPADRKAVFALLNFRFKIRDKEEASSLLEKISQRADKYSAIIQFLLDYGSQVTGRAIIGCQDFPESLALIMAHLRKAGQAWYQEPQQGYEILAAMIASKQPIEEIRYYLQLESARKESGVLKYVGIDGITFSNLLDSIDGYGDEGYRPKIPPLVQLLVEHKAIVTGKSISILCRQNYKNLALDLLRECRFEDICKKPPRHGSELMSGIIVNLKDPIEQLKPWLESKDEKALSAILAYGMSTSSPLSIVCNPRILSENWWNFMLLLVRKGAIPSGKDLRFLNSTITMKRGEKRLIPAILSGLNTYYLFAHAVEDVHDLLSATIETGWLCADIERLLDFSDKETISKVVNYHQPFSLLSRILSQFQTQVEARDNLLQLIELLVAKGYRLRVSDLYKLSQDHSLIWAALAKSDFEPMSEKEQKESSDVITSLIESQAPVEYIQGLMCSHRYLPCPNLNKFFSLLASENWASILAVILNFSLKLPGDGYNRDSILDILKNQYRETQNAGFKQGVADITVAISNFEASVDLNRLESSLVDTSIPLFITKEYFTQINILIMQLCPTVLPKVLAEIVLQYAYYPPRLEKLLLQAVQGEENPQQVFRLLPVTSQSDLGFCAAHAAFNGQLSSAIRRADPTQLESFFSEETKDHPRNKGISFFLDKSHEVKQGEEDGTPVHMRQLLKESAADSTTMVPFTSTEEAVKIGQSEPTLSLEMLKDLLQLYSKFHKGETINHSFVIYLNDIHWLTVSWVGKQAESLWMGMDSRPEPQADLLERFCNRLQELFTGENTLKELGRRILTQSHQELKPLLGKVNSAEDLLFYLNPIQALLEVYSVLEKSSVPLQQLLDEKQRSQFTTIASLVKKFIDPKTPGHFTKCSEIIQELETSLFVAQPSSASLSTPGGPCLLTSHGSSSSSLSTQTVHTPTQ